MQTLKLGDTQIEMDAPAAPAAEATPGPVPAQLLETLQLGQTPSGICPTVEGAYGLSLHCILPTGVGSSIQAYKAAMPASFTVSMHVLLNWSDVSLGQL